MQLLDQQREWVVRVGQSAEHAFAHRGHRVRGRHSRGESGGQRDRADEVAYHIGELRPAAPGGGRADDDLVLPRVAMQQGGERGQQRDVRRHARLVAELPHLFGQRLAQVQRLDGAAESLHGRAGPVRGQLEHRQRHLRSASFQYSHIRSPEGEASSASCHRAKSV